MYNRTGRVIYWRQSSGHARDERGRQRRHDRHDAETVKAEPASRLLSDRPIAGRRYVAGLSPGLSGSRPSRVRRLGWQRLGAGMKGNRRQFACAHLQGFRARPSAICRHGRLAECHTSSPTMARPWLPALRAQSGTCAQPVRGSQLGSRAMPTTQGLSVHSRLVVLTARCTNSRPIIFTVIEVKHYRSKRSEQPPVFRHFAS